MKIHGKNLYRLNFVFLAGILLFAGCDKGTADSLPPNSVTTTTTETAVTTAETTTAAAWQDSFDEEAFLESYIYTSPPINNTPFSSAEELGKGAVLDYCYARMIMNAEKLDPAPPDEYENEMRYMSAEILAKYAKQTLGLENFSFTEYYSYDAEKNAYLMRVVPKDYLRKSYMLPRMMYLAKTEDSVTVTATFSNDETLAPLQLLYKHVYTFVPNGDGFRLLSFEIVDESEGTRKFLPDDTTLIKKIFDTPAGNVDLLRAISVSGNRVLVAADNYYHLRATQLGNLNTDTGKMEKWIKLPYQTPVLSYPSGVIALLKKEIAYYDTDLNPVQTIKIPEELCALTEDLPKIFGSPDKKLLAYSDADGIYLYDLDKKEKRLLFEHPNVNPENFNDVRIYSVEGFTKDSGKLICRLMGSPLLLGYRIYNLQTNTYIDLETKAEFSLPAYADFNNDTLVYTDNPTPATAENPYARTGEYHLYQYNIADNTSLKRTIPASQVSVNTCYTDGFLFNTPYEYPQTVLTKTQMLQYNIAEDKTSVIQASITDYFPLMHILAKLPNGKLLAAYNSRFGSGYAIISDASAPYVPQ